MGNFTKALGVVSGSSRLQMFARPDIPNGFNLLDIDAGTFHRLAGRPEVYWGATVRGGVFASRYNRDPADVVDPTIGRPAGVAQDPAPVSDALSMDGIRKFAPYCMEADARTTDAIESTATPIPDGASQCRMVAQYSNTSAMEGNTRGLHRRRN